jgi:hypothetical protein
MTKDEALKLALDALEADPAEMVEDENGHMVFRRIQAIITLREALAQTEQDGKCKRCTDGCPACDARKLPEQDWIERERAVGYREGHRAALAQRTWVGLTDEEVKKIVGLDRYTDLLKEVVQYVEAKLRSKNNG